MVSTIKELQSLAKNNGIKIYSRLGKAELERYLSDKGIFNPQQKPKQVVSPMLKISENEENEENEEPVEQAFEKGHRRFMIGGGNVNIKRYIELNTEKLKTLIEDQLRDLGSVKVQTTLWVKWVMDGDIFVDKAFNSKMTEIFQESNLGEVIEKLTTHMKTQMENPALPRSVFTVHNIALPRH